MEIACVMYKVQAGTKGTAVSLNLTLEHVRSISPRLQCIDVYDVLVMNSCACGEILQCVWFVNTATAHLKESHVQVFFGGGGGGVNARDSNRKRTPEGLRSAEVF